MEKKSNNYILVNVGILFLICISIIFVGRYFIFKKESELLEKKYSAITSMLKIKANSLIQTKKNATLAISLTLAENEKIKETLISSKDNYELDKLSKKLRDYTDFKNVWFQIINKEGISVYRSWTDNKDDNIKDFRLDLKDLFNNPMIKNTISVGKYDVTFKSIIPLFKDEEFIGVLEGITHFNSISRNLRNNDKVEPIILVNNIFTEQLNEKGFTKIFLKNYYVANISVSKELLSYLDTQELNKFLEIENYLIKDNKLIINIPIIEDNILLANLLIFKDLDLIEIQDIKEFRKNAFLYLGFFLVFLCLTSFIISYYIHNKRLKELNQILQQTVNEEIMKNDEKNKIIFQQNKMAAMGEMIGNIAHQWRQPLSVITTSASAIKLKKEYGILEDKDHEESLSYIIDAANYLSNTIDDFRFYFSPNKSKNTFKSSVFMDKCIKLIQIDFKINKIDLIKNIDDFDINSYENELLQVVINILNNAKDELLKDNMKNKDKYIFIDLYKKDKNLIIKIKDNAGGIKPEIIDRIFEPYFTTKHKSKGTGIGLYMCEEIVIKHIKGNITVSTEIYNYNNEELKGAMFEITVPL